MEGANCDRVLLEKDKIVRLHTRRIRAASIEQTRHTHVPERTADACFRVEEDIASNYQHPTDLGKPATP